MANVHIPGYMQMDANERTTRFETLWGTLVAKRNRLRELRAAGCYGFQLQAPRAAANRAAVALSREFPAEARCLGVQG